jgi:hypothetical protein
MHSRPVAFRRIRLQSPQRGHITVLSPGNTHIASGSAMCPHSVRTLSSRRSAILRTAAGLSDVPRGCRLGELVLVVGGAESAGAKKPERECQRGVPCSIDAEFRVVGVDVPLAGR